MKVMLRNSLTSIGSDFVRVAEVTATAAVTSGVTVCCNAWKVKDHHMYHMTISQK
jgi:hypothetical protein